MFANDYNMNFKNYGQMATIYKVEIVSEWINWDPKDLEEMIKKAIEDKQMNTVKVKAERKQ